jgi:hypothetical protein
MSGFLDRVLLAMSALLVFGCRSEPTRPAGETTFSDSAGIRIATGDLRDAEALRRCTVAAEPELRIGTTDGPVPTQLFRVEDVLRLPDGRIVVLNRGTQEVRFFDATGSFVNRLGRDGEGPGEFRDPIEIAMLGSDSLVVWDWELNRVSVLTTAGEFVRSFPPRPAVENPTGRIGVTDNGRTIIIASHEVRIPTGPDFLPQRLLLLRYDVEGLLLDTAATLRYGSVGVIDAESRMAGGPLFDARGAFATDGTNLYVTDGSDAEVRVFDGPRELARIVRWTPPDLTVTQEDVERYRSERLEGLSGDALLITRKRYEAVPISDRFPAVSGILVDSDGGMWVRRFQQPFHERQTWWRFDGGGAFRCAVDLPIELTVVRFDGGLVIAVDRDDQGTESVVTLRISDAER